ncbi:MAG: SRPBCC family protein [Gaiellaceae bacterium]
MRITESIRIDRSPEDVWAIVSDLDTHTTWRPALVEFRQLSDGPLEVGTRIREVLRWRKREIEIEDVVTALEPPRRLGFRGGWSAADFEVEFRLEPDGEGTRVTMDWPLYPKSLLMRVAAPFLKGTMGRATAEELGHLKALAERRAHT